MTGHGSGLEDKVGISWSLALMIFEVFPNLSDSEILFSEHISLKEELWS